MKFKDVKIGQLFSEASTCEIFIKVSETESHIWNAGDKDVWINVRTGRHEAYEFPLTHEVEEYEE